jgi:hypothetical protein
MAMQLSQVDPGRACAQIQSCLASRNVPKLVSSISQLRLMIESSPQAAELGDSEDLLSILDEVRDANKRRRKTQARENGRPQIRFDIFVFGCSSVFLIVCAAQ